MLIGREVMTNRKSVYEIMERDGKFSILLKLLNKTALGKALRHEEKPFTFFAPTDGAFYKLFQQVPSVLPEDISKILITPILGQHLIPGVCLYSDDLRLRSSVITLEGTTLEIRQDDHRIFVNDAQILTPGLPALNGVIFAIDKVLLIETEEITNQK